MQFSPLKKALDDSVLEARHSGESRNPEVVPTKVGNQSQRLGLGFHRDDVWIPVFTGMTSL